MAFARGIDALLDVQAMLHLRQDAHQRRHQHIIYEGEYPDALAIALISEAKLVLEKFA